MSATAAALVKAAILALTDENTRKKIGWVLAAILSPVILLIAFLCALGSGTASHMLVIHGSAAETKDYERAIILIGSAWGLDPQNAVSHLELITREKEAARGTAEPEETRHVLPESELPMNASGMETLDNVCGLFETAIQLESRDHREALFRLASKLMETQNLLDWIEKTPEEQELPELAES